MNVISVPADHYLSAGAIEALRSPGLLERTPQPDQSKPALIEPIAPEIKPQSPYDAKLVAELNTLSLEELARRAGVSGVD